MGTVFEAVDEVLGRRVAIKRLKAVDESGRRRFWREARAVARLSHPNVCQLYEVGEDVSGPFLAMELLSGEPLSLRLRSGPMTAAEVVSLGAGMLAALSAIHAAGLVHRDLKPSNVYLTPYGPRLLDFGLVRHLPSDLARMMPSNLATPGPISGTPITDPRNLIGTPGYMAPEQILGQAVDARADLFAVGTVLYEALAGRRAFPGTNVLEVLTATLNQAPDPLPAPLARLDAFLRRALAKKPAERFATAQEMAEALHAASAAPPAGARDRAGSENGEIFVGRTAELAWLQERLDGSLAGAGGVVFVTGERGAGKSALVGEMLRRVRGSRVPITVVAGRCLEHQGPRDPLQPFLDALGRLFGTSRGREQAVELVKTWAPTIGVLMPAALVPDPDGSLHRQTAGATRERLIREAGDFIDAATRLYPVVLLLEDLQWADPVSVEVLCHLGRRAARQRFLILGTCRPSEVEGSNLPLHRGMLELRTAGHGHELALGPLDAPDVEQWLERRFPGNDFAAVARSPAPRARRRPAALRAQPVRAARWPARHRAAARRIPARAAARGARPRAVEGREGPGARTPRDAARSRARAARRRERPRQGVLERDRPRPRERKRARARGAHAAALPREPGAREPRRGGAARRRARDPLPLRARPLPARALRGPRRPAPRRAPPAGRRAAGAPLGREHAVARRRGGRALRARPRRRARGPLSDARGRARRAPLRGRGGRRALHRGPRAAPQAARRGAASRSRRRSTAGALRRACCSPVSTRPRATTRSCSNGRARRASPPPAARRSSGLCNAHFFEQRPLEMSARAREALQAAERYGSPHHLAEARGRVAQSLVMEGRLEGVPPRARRRDRRGQGERLAGSPAARPRLPRLRALLAKRVRCLRSTHGRGTRCVRGAWRRLRGLRRTHVPGARSSQPGPDVGGAGRLRAGQRCSPPATAIASGSRGWSASRAGSTASSLRSSRRASSTHARWRWRARTLRPGRRRWTRSSTCASTTCAPATPTPLPTCWPYSRTAPAPATGSAG